MIEVEKNFGLRKGDKERLIGGARFLWKKIFTDAYYDSDAYALTGNDLWLRSRNGRFELKVPLNAGSIRDRATDQYRELETDGEIAGELGLNPKHGLKNGVSEKGYRPFAAITTTRERYQKGGFHLDFDETDFGFSAFEAELLVEKPEEIPLAEKRIIRFGEEQGVKPVSAGKVIEYLRRFRPEHLAFLKTRGVA